MNVQEVAASIIASSHIRTAFDISAALDEVRHQLLSRFTGQLLAQLPSLTAAGHCQDDGFLRAAGNRPFLLYRNGPGTRPGTLPWGSFAIGLAFERGRLFYGIRDTATERRPRKPPLPAAAGGPAARLRAALQNAGAPREGWPWWQWAGPAAERDLYPALADQVAGRSCSTLVTQLLPEIERLASVLDRHCQAPPA